MAVKYNKGRGYKVAIIGVGAVANLHAKAIQGIEGLKLVAGSCRTRDKGEVFAERFDCRWYRDYEEMLDTHDIDIVLVASPSGAHMVPVMECLGRDIHVMCEKPLEIETGRIDQMIAIADDSKAQLGAFFPQRYNPVNQVLHHAAQVGRFEKVAVASCLVPWWRDDAYYSKERWQGTMELDGGGAMMNQSIHGVDLVQWVVSAAIKAEAPEEWDVRDNPVDEVFAWTDKLGHDPDLIEVEDTCVANIRYKNGAMGQFLGATSMFPGLLKRTIVGGFGGSVEIQEDELVKYSFAEPQDYDQKVRSYFEKKKTTTGGGAGDPMAIDHGNHQRNIQAFVEAIDEGKPFELDAREARKAVAIIEAIYESARTNQPVVLEPTAIGP